jgi:two-component system CheB/CheR fusion protein
MESRSGGPTFQVRLEDVPVGVVHNWPDGRYSYVNPAFCELLGYTAEELLGKTWQDVTHPDDRAGDQRLADELLAGRIPHFTVEKRYLRKDGEVVWVNLFGTFVRGDDGRPLHGVGIAIDVTERRRAELALAEAYARLREADRRKNQFLAVLSHELRNPLAPIRNSLYVLEHSAPGGEQAARAREVIERQTLQLTRLVDDLLEVTRITQGKIRLQREVIELGGFLRRCAEDHQALFDEAGIAFELAVPAAPIHVNADPARLSQIVGNLLRNAAKFTPRGGRTWLALEAAGEWLAIRVRDTGEGIPAELLGRLFEPFVQAEETLDRTRGGLGLGLAVLKGLAELHGGTVVARSEGRGKGAEFVVTLPAVGRSASAGPPPPIAKAPRPKRVLVIEDNPDGAQSLRLVLELQGHSVTLASDGKEGIKKARTLRPEVVLCDLGLPGVDGFEVGRTLRHDPALAGTALIAVSGYAQPEDVKRARDAGFEQHLVKPVDPDDLARI